MSSLIVSEISAHAAAPPDGDPAILLDDVHVHYRHQKNRPTTLKEFVVRKLQGEIRVDEIRALDGVTLSIARGEVFGVVGQNGAGKSTLLKVISKIVHPSQGRVRIWGRVSTQLSVGAGFHTDLTGLENIYLYSAILGRSRSETESLVDDVVAFAELDEFIHAPLRTYSAGMRARLGFATAMAQVPDILLIDEVLAVGDLRFKEKCKRRFQEMVQHGATIVLVSHGLQEVVSLCDRAAWLERGSIMSMGNPTNVVGDYRRSIEGG